ncbi:MAG: MAPEG family protein, partial [Asticcacaulis sp.]
MSDPFARQIMGAMIALMLLQLVMAVVVLGVRAPLLMKAGVKPGAKLTRRDADRLPDWARAPGDNYNNLFEAPTAFFAVCLTIVVT